MAGTESPAIVAAGYGGRFSDSGQEVELLYVKDRALEDEPSGLASDDELYASAFKPLRLPAFGVTERGVWPALVFTSTEGGAWRLYAMSRELAALINRVQEMQIF